MISHIGMFILTLLWFLGYKLVELGQLIWIILKSPFVFLGFMLADESDEDTRILKKVILLIMGGILGFFIIPYAFGLIMLQLDWLTLVGSTQDNHFVKAWCKGYLPFFGLLVLTSITYIVSAIGYFVFWKGSVRIYKFLASNWEKASRRAKGQ